MSNSPKQTNSGIRSPSVPASGRAPGTLLGMAPNFWPALRDHPPPVPQQLMRKLASTDVCSVGKVKVLLRVSSSVETPGSPKVLEVDPRKKTVTLFDPGSMTSSPTPQQEHSRVGIAAPKMFAFDGIFNQDDSQTEVCSAALSDVIVAVLRGADGSVFSFGQANLGQTYTMLGTPASSHSLGVIPSALWWLYRALEDRRTHTGARFSVRVSALQVAAGDIVTDLLSQFATDDQPPGVFLMEQDVGNAAILPKACEVRAPNAERAAHLLDAALSNRHIDAHGRAAHFVYTFNIYQYSVDTSSKGGVAGGRSRLHFLDFGSLDRGKGSSRLSVSALGNVLLAIFNGQKHLPYKDSRLPRLVRECVGSVRCVSSLLVHVSGASIHFQETLATVQLASRVHRLRRRRIKAHVGGSGSGGSSEESRSGRSSRGTITETGSSSVDPSSSEQSCDTVIYVGPGADDATDGEHPPVYLPSINSGDNRCSMRKALRGSSLDSISKYQENQRTKKSSKSSVNSKSKSPKHSSHKGSSPQRTKDGSGKCKETSDGGVNSAVSGHNDTVTKSSNSVSPGTVSRTPSKHINSSIVIKLCSGATPKSPKSPHISRHKSHKSQPTTQPQDASGAPEVSDEQWIDGPRVSKSKILEGHKAKSYELETWIDGPEATYGYMDDHKKSMIQKWVETQNNNVPTKGDGTPTKSSKHTHYKELTQFKTVDDEEVSPKHKEKHKEKRRSSEIKDSKKDSKSHHLSAKEKDSPNRRKSYTDKSHSQTDNDGSRAKSQANSASSTPSKSSYYSKDNPIVGSGPPNNSTTPPDHQSYINHKLQRSNSLTQGKGEPLSKQVLITNSQNRPSSNAIVTNSESAEEKTAPKSNNKPVNGEQSDTSVGVSNGIPSTKGAKIIDETKLEGRVKKLEAEEEDVLQIIYIQTEEGTVDTKIHQKLSRASVGETVDSFSEDGSSAASNPEEAVPDELELHLEENLSVTSSEEGHGEVVLEDELLKEGSRRIILHEVPFDLDGLDEEAEEELNLSLDRWLADEEREFIEVTEPDEPVEMVDSWVQVTEEDLERTMAEAGISFVPFLPHRHILPTLEEEPQDTPPEETQEFNSMIVHANAITKNIMKNNSIYDHSDFRGSSRYEQMIKDPNFTAKTHYFAKRLEELRQLHEVYRNLAKQAPRGRNSVYSPIKLVPQLSEEDDFMQDGSSVSESVDEIESKLSSSSFDGKSSTLASLKFNGSFEFDWKSLLPEELDLHSEFGDVKNEGDESASEVSKETNDPLYDIQSDIMPYLPSNYVNLTNLSTKSKHSSSNPSTQNELKLDLENQAKGEEEEGDGEEEEEEDEGNGNEKQKESHSVVISNSQPISDIIIPERPHIIVASLSDDENNVKQIKAKKEKRKKKLGLLSKSNKNSSKKENENDQGSVSAKLSWSRFFGSPKQKNSLKESSKKSKNSSKQNGKTNFIGKSSEKNDKKYQKEKSKETKNSSFKEEKQKEAKNSSENELVKSSEKTSKYFQKVESERHVSSPKSSKSPSRRSSDSRSGSSSSNRSQRRNESSGKGQQPQQQQQPIHMQQHSDGSTKSLAGVRYQGNFQWDSHLQSFQPATTSVHGYDSGTDSGVGLKVTPRGKRSRLESRHGESSGYESVIRDSECSSFGSSQDSGLDDDGQKGKIEGKGKFVRPSTDDRSEFGSNKAQTKAKTPTREGSCSSASPKKGSLAQSASLDETGKMKANLPPPNRLTSPMELALHQVEDFDEEDVARYENHTTDEDIIKCRRTQEKIRALREKQDELKKELEAAKGRLTIDKSRWSFELHVEECMTYRDDGFLEALTQETLILAKRVMAARSRVLVATTFDVADRGDQSLITSDVPYGILEELEKTP